MKGSILFVEDNKEYRELLISMLENEGYNVVGVSNGLDAIKQFTITNYDLIISDLMMESIDGIQLFSYLKNENEKIKTMILTAEPSMDTELESLNINVDKYISKDTRVDVLLKHIEKLIQSAETIQRKMLIDREENIILDLKAHKVSKNGEEIFLSPKEFGVLKLLLANIGQVVSREHFITELWDEDNENVDMRVIDVHIKTLRRKLNVLKIVSIRGLGYRWDN